MSGINILRGLQRYKCKKCLYRYTVERKSDVKTKETRRLALEMYLEGLGFRAIGRILRISYGTVYVWVKEWGSKVSLPRRETPIRIVELDEMHTYVGQKKTTVVIQGRDADGKIQEGIFWFRSKADPNDWFECERY